MYKKIFGIFIIALFLLTSFSNISATIVSTKSNDTSNINSKNILTNYQDIKKYKDFWSYNPIFDIKTFFTSLDNNLIYEPTNQNSELYRLGYSVKQTNDNGFIICGITGNFYTQTGLLLKTDDQGYMIWNKTFLVRGNTLCYSVEQTIDSGYIITGGTSDTFNVTTYAFLYKTDNMGNNIWNKTYKFSDPATGITVKQTNDGGYIISGITLNYNSSEYKGFLIKTDNSGEEIWVKTYDYNVFINDLDQTADGGYIIGGTIAEISPFKFCAFLLKTDKHGNETWYKTFKILNNTYGYSVIQTKDTGYILCGYSDLGGLLLKTNSQGIEIWNQSYSNQFCISIQQTTDNGYIIGGITGFEDEIHALLLKTDEHGKKIWYKNYKYFKETQITDIYITTQGDFILTGRTSEEIFYQDSYILLIKTNSKGDQQWYKIFNITGVNSGYIKFYGWDISKSNQEVNIHIGNYRYGQGVSGYSSYYETEYIELCPGYYKYEFSWYGKESKPRSITGFINISSNQYIKIKQNLTFTDDLPELSITKPKKAIYINNKTIIPFLTSIIFGNIDILVNASDASSGIDHIEFYIDDELKFNDTTEPYSWQWNEKKFGVHTINIVAFDKVGYKNSSYVKVIKFF